MTPYDEKKKDGCSMTPQFPHKAQQAQNRWLSPLLPSIFAAGSLIATVASASLVAATECQVTEEEGETIQGMTAWKGATSSTLSLTNTVGRYVYGEFAPSPAREGAPYMNNIRFAWGNTVDQEIASIGACLRQDIRKSARFTQAMIKPIVKTQTKALTQVMKVSILPYTGKRQALKIRTTLPEIRISVRDKTLTIIGPVQETPNPILPDERSVSRSVAAPPSIGQSPSFGGQPFVALNQFQSALQLPGNESLRMNLTTTQALHEGNCANGCP
jgi:hypothetical protein